MSKKVYLPFVEPKAINELPERTTLAPGNMFAEDDDGKTFRIRTETFYQILNKFAKALKINAPTPSIDGWYKPEDAGVYSNAGNLVAQEGYDTLFEKLGTTWTRTQVKMPGASISPTFNPTSQTEAQGGKQIADYVKKPESIGAVQVSGGGPDVSPTLNFILNDSYIDAAGVVQSNPGTKVSDFIPRPAGYSKLTADEAGTFALATYGDSNTFLATLGGVGTPVEFNKTWNLNPNVKSVRFIHRTATMGTALLTFKSDGGAPKYVLPWLPQVESSRVEFKQNVRDIAASFNFTSNPVVGNVIISGDSTIATYLGGAAIVDLISVTGTKTSIAVPGHTILQQQTAYQALASGTKTGANYVFVQVGLNDVTYTGNANAAIARMQTYINVIKAGSPNAQIIVCAMNPALAAWKGADPVNYLTAQSNWDQLNYFYEFGLSGVNKFIDLHVETISDGNGNLDTIYNVSSPDGIHENTAARKIIAYSWISNYEK